MNGTKVKLSNMKNNIKVITILVNNTQVYTSASDVLLMNHF